MAEGKDAEHWLGVLVLPTVFHSDGTWKGPETLSPILWGSVFSRETLTFLPIV